MNCIQGSASQNPSQFPFLFSFSLPRSKYFVCQGPVLAPWCVSSNHDVVQTFPWYYCANVDAEMLDPLTALALTGNVLQFIDFGLKATSKAREVYVSADGITAENADLEVLTTDIASVSEKLVASSGNSSGNDSLDDISRRCKASAADLLVALRKLKVEGRKGKWKSVRKGLKAVWGKRKVDDLRVRLESWRDEIQFHVVVQLRYAMTCALRISQ